MTDAEIIKALERCGQHRECCYCNSVEECGSKRVLVYRCLSLINRQKAENAELQHKISSCNSENAELKAEIERLQIRNKTLTEIIKNYDWKFEKAKAEAIKEFAERLEKKANSRSYCTILESDVDNLVKEMTE